MDTVKIIPVWRHKDSFWSLGLITANALPGFIQWDTSTTTISILDINNTPVVSFAAADVTSSHLSADIYVLRTKDKIYRFKIRNSQETNAKSPLSVVKDFTNTFVFDNLGSSYLDERSATKEFADFLKSHSNPEYASRHYRPKYTFTSVIILAVAIIIVAFVIGLIRH